MPSRGFALVIWPGGRLPGLPRHRWNRCPARVLQSNVLTRHFFQVDPRDSADENGDSADASIPSGTGSSSHGFPRASPFARLDGPRGQDRVTSQGRNGGCRLPLQRILGAFFKREGHPSKWMFGVYFPSSRQSLVHIGPLLRGKGAVPSRRPSVCSTMSVRLNHLTSMQAMCLLPPKRASSKRRKRATKETR